MTEDNKKEDERVMTEIKKEGERRKKGGRKERRRRKKERLKVHKVNFGSEVVVHEY